MAEPAGPLQPAGGQPARKWLARWLPDRLQPASVWPAKWWPDTLAGRVAAILLAGLALSCALAYLAVMRERGALSRTMMAAYAGRDVATAVAVLNRLDAAERPAWLARLARPHYRYALGPVPLGADAAVPAGALQEALQGLLAAELGAGRVQALGRDGGGALVFRLHLADTTPLWLLVHPPRLAVSTETAWLLAAQLLVLGAFVAWAARTATAPLRRMSEAAQALGTDPQGPPLPERGPAEVRLAARAFNTMQQQVAEHIAERLQILAAISHDLQTPITRMRVRTELLPDGAVRDKLAADLAEMQRLIEEGLAYARSAHAQAEPLQAVDLGALLDALACDYADAGAALALQATPGIVLHTRPQALRRIVANLLDNALKFAGAAEITAQPGPDGVIVCVLDRGPGIPADQLAAVLRPFHRVEAARSPGAGGSGLGLAIAQRLAQAIGAGLSLHRREGGGLEARLHLPLVAAPVRQP